MPYIGKEREAELIANPKLANKSGDYNALYTMAYLKAFLAKPSYDTIHWIRKASIVPTLITGVEDVDVLLKDLGADDMDMTAARELAFEEFYLRVGHPYENMKRNQNGDLELYKEAGKILHGMAMEIAGKMLSGGK